MLDNAHDDLAACAHESEAYAVIAIWALLYYIGLPIRAFYLALPATIEHGDPEASNIANNRMRICQGWIRPSVSFQQPHFKCYRELRNNAMNDDNEAAEELESEFIKKESWSHGFRKMVTMKLRKEKPASIFDVMNSPGGSVVKAARRLWQAPSWVIFGIQVRIIIDKGNSAMVSLSFKS